MPRYAKRTHTRRLTCRIARMQTRVTESRSHITSKQRKFRNHMEQRRAYLPIYCRHQRCDFEKSPPDGDSLLQRENTGTRVCTAPKGKDQDCNTRRNTPATKVRRLETHKQKTGCWRRSLGWAIWNRRRLRRSRRLPGTTRHVYIHNYTNIRSGLHLVIGSAV